VLPHRRIEGHSNAFSDIFYHGGVAKADVCRAEISPKILGVLWFVDVFDWMFDVAVVTAAFDRPIFIRARIVCVGDVDFLRFWVGAIFLDIGVTYSRCRVFIL
jgi:hypothetical protein